MFRRRPILTVAAVGAAAGANRREAQAKAELNNMKQEQKMQQMINQNNQQQAAQQQQQQNAPPAPSGLPPYPGCPQPGQPLPPPPPGYYYPQAGQAPPPPPPGYYYPQPGQAPPPQYAPPAGQYPPPAQPQYTATREVAAPAPAPMAAAPPVAPQTPPAAAPVAVAAAVVAGTPMVPQADLLQMDDPAAPAPVPVSQAKPAQVARPADEPPVSSNGIVFYTHPLAFNPAKVAIMLAEKNVIFDQVTLDILTGENLEPKFMTINPLGQVPTLVVNGAPITESLRICEYLDTIDNKPLGGNAVDRAFVKEFAKAIDKFNGNLWAFGHSTPELLDKLMQIDVYRKSFAAKQSRENPAMRAVYSAKIKTLGVNLDLALDPDEVAAVDLYLSQLLDRAEQRLQPAGSVLFLAGPEFSMVDALFAPILFRIHNLGMDEQLIKPRRALAGYFARIAARDSYAQAYEETPDTWGGGAVLRRALMKIKARSAA